MELRGRLWSAFRLSAVATHEPNAPTTRPWRWPKVLHLGTNFLHGFQYPAKALGDLDVHERGRVLNDFIESFQDAIQPFEQLPGPMGSSLSHLSQCPSSSLSANFNGVGLNMR